MHELWTIATANMAYARLQNYTNLVVGENGIQAIEVVVVMLLLVMLLFDVFVPTSAHPILFLDK